MWTDRYVSVCREHPELVAVYECRRTGRLALLLRQTLVPLAVERIQCFEETSRAVESITTSLRAAGLEDTVVVLQWRSLPEIARVVSTWACRYDSDPTRRQQLARTVYRNLADGRFLASRSGRTALADHPERLVDRLTRDGGHDDRAREGLCRWYKDMSPCWLGAEPPIRRQLILRTHQWILDRVIGTAPGGAVSLPDPGPDSALAAMLRRAIPETQVGRWRHWIELVVADLRCAMRWPVGLRNEAWARWLFLIPYSIPVGIDACSPSAASPESGVSRSP